MKKTYIPGSKEPYRMSRKKLELFVNCPRCFYLECRLGIKQPPTFPYTLNLAVDKLLKKEFDIYRSKQSVPPLLIENNIEALPYLHFRLREWQDGYRRGITYSIPNTNLILAGGIDDLWLCTKTKELMIVDYKATANSKPVTLDDAWKNSYKRQVEVYQWLFRQNGFKVSDIAYFVYCNGKINVKTFDKQLNFDISFIPYQGNTDWIEAAVMNAYKCLNSNKMPVYGKDCDFCRYSQLLDKNNVKKIDSKK